MSNPVAKSTKEVTPAYVGPPLYSGGTLCKICSDDHDERHISNVDTTYINADGTKIPRLGGFVDCQLALRLASFSEIVKTDREPLYFKISIYDGTIGKNLIQATQAGSPDFTFIVPNQQKKGVTYDALPLQVVTYKSWQSDVRGVLICDDLGRPVHFKNGWALVLENIPR